MGKGYRVAVWDDSPTVECPCGQSTRLLTRADTPICNVHVTHIFDSRRHYHKKCTEVYFILEGRGKMELDGDLLDVRPGMAILIEPGTRHRLWGDVRALIVGIPALEPDDEYFDEEDLGPDRVSSHVASRLS
jgi:uncharacterized protein YjlB